jgi:hypothetical protein
MFLNFVAQNFGLRKVFSVVHIFAVLNFAAQNLKIAGWEWITNFAWAKFVIPGGEAFKVKTLRTGVAGFLFVQIRFKNRVFGGFEQTKNPSLGRWVLTLAEKEDCEPISQTQ